LIVARQTAFVDFRLPPIPYLEAVPLLKDATWSGRKIDQSMQRSLPNRFELSPAFPTESSPSLYAS
jgi:hypothetical protein